MLAQPRTPTKTESERTYAAIFMRLLARGPGGPAAVVGRALGRLPRGRSASRALTARAAAARLFDLQARLATGNEVGHEGEADRWQECESHTGSDALTRAIGVPDQLNQVDQAALGAGAAFSLPTRPFMMRSKSGCSGAPSSRTASPLRRRRTSSARVRSTMSLPLRSEKM